MSLKKTIATIGLVGVLCGTASAAFAVSPVEGGTWNFGLAAGVRAYSDYIVGRCHGTTVINDWGTNRSVDIAANAWANSAMNATAFTNNHYYYRVC